MCFQPLVDEEEASKPISDIVRSEITEAARGGVLAAVLVVVVLGLSDTPALLTAGTAVGAFVLAILLHQAVLVVGLGVRRLVTTDAGGSADAV